MALSELALPILAAPMAGGASTPALILAAARAGGLGFLAGGYQTAVALDAQIRAVRTEGVEFGVNLFAPNPVPVSVPAFRDYARAVQLEADRFGLTLAGSEPIEDDDHWAEKVEVLLADPVPMVSFTFGVPSREVVSALRKAGSLVLQTVTSAEEARIAADAGVDALIVQSSAAGGHSATLTPARPPGPVPLPDLIGQVQYAVGALPLVAAGGIVSSAELRVALGAGATAGMVGTVLLRTQESGASKTHRAALADPAFDQTAVTRAFTGRPARGLRNRFVERFDGLAPLGYPALHHLTSPLRKAAAAAGEPGLVHLWAGTGYRKAREEPAASTLARLAAGL
jgi:nitronate monooxygenase